MENVRTILLHAREIKKEKQSFIACASNINGTWYKIKFRKDCENIPKIKGLYDLTIDFDYCSIERGRTWETEDGKSGKNDDIIWVEKIVSIRQYTEEELKQGNRDKMSAIFGG